MCKACRQRSIWARIKLFSSILSLKLRLTFMCDLFKEISLLSRKYLILFLTYLQYHAQRIISHLKTKYSHLSIVSIFKEHNQWSNIDSITKKLVKTSWHFAIQAKCQEKQWEPGGDLLSHANAHYHRRNSVSRFCSGWEDVGPECYDHQAKLSAYHIKDYVCISFASSLKE